MYDKERLKNEGEFIFSRNRLNVSLTRGKQKTIVLLSDVLSDPSLTTHVLRHTSRALHDGIDYIQGFAKYMSYEEKDGSGKTVDEMENRYFSYFFGVDATVKMYKKKLKLEGE